MKRSDLLTGETFIPKRINQLFARSENRIRYHNRKANKLRHSVAHINKPLLQNLKILNSIMKSSEEKTFHRQFLLGKGINFSVLTHHQKVDGKNIACIYHFAITRLDNETVLIKKIQKND